MLLVVGWGLSSVLLTVCTAVLGTFTITGRFCVTLGSVQTRPCNTKPQINEEKKSGTSNDNGCVHAAILSKSWPLNQGFLKLSYKCYWVYENKDIVVVTFYTALCMSNTPPHFHCYLLFCSPCGLLAWNRTGQDKNDTSVS